MDIMNRINIWLDNFINNGYGNTIVKCLLVLFIVAFIIQFIKGVFNALKRFILNAKRGFTKIFRNDIVADVINNKIIAAPLFSKNDFFWDNPSILNIQYYIKILVLIKSGILLLLHPKYIRRFFKDSIKLNKSTVNIENLEISIDSGLVKSDILFSVEMSIKNIGTEIVELALPKGQKKEWFVANIYLNTGEIQAVFVSEILNEEFLMNGRINAGGTIKFSIFFETVYHKLLRKITSIEIKGFLKTKGSKEHKAYRIPFEDISHDKNDYFEWIKGSFCEEELFNVYKRGGFLYIVCILILVNFMICIFLNNIILQLVIFIVSLTIFIIF